MCWLPQGLRIPSLAAVTQPRWVRCKAPRACICDSSLMGPVRDTRLGSLVHHQNVHAVGVSNPQSLKLNCYASYREVCCSGGSSFGVTWWYFWDRPATLSPCVTNTQKTAGMRNLSSLKNGEGLIMNQTLQYNKCVTNTHLISGILGTALPERGYKPFAR